MPVWSQNRIVQSICELSTMHMIRFRRGLGLSVEAACGLQNWQIYKVNAHSSGTDSGASRVNTPPALLSVFLYFQFHYFSTFWSCQSIRPCHHFPSTSMSIAINSAKLSPSSLLFQYIIIPAYYSYFDCYQQPLLYFRNIYDTPNLFIHCSLSPSDPHAASSAIYVHNQNLTL